MVCLCVHFFGGRIYSFQIFLQGWATHQKIKSSCLSLNPRSPEGAFHASQFQLLNQLHKCWLDFAISKRSLQIAISAYLSISTRTMMHFVQCALEYLQSTSSEIRKVSDLYRCCFSWGGPRAGVLLELRSSRICLLHPGFVRNAESQAPPVASGSAFHKIPRWPMYPGVFEKHDVEHPWGAGRGEKLKDQEREIAVCWPSSEGKHLYPQNFLWARTRGCVWMWFRSWVIPSVRHSVNLYQHFSARWICTPAPCPHIF